ncbi:ABC transporter permease [Colwellia sp. BRX10-4]|jgi:ABC-type antimicrobial peptide transport system permease subunit|uniref:ABC transporter permease n=1 Tax=Colwellia sp. BRX10-4 TaxID=2759843 RepID=UPI0015F5FEAE|nr:ABC transporter permease [Colwellia sp. BRX10-4]MBA6397607.1 ABC transporter permease [Colwellia sp. BRX10-4]
MISIAKLPTLGALNIKNSAFNAPFVMLFSVAFSLLISIGSIFYNTVIQPLPYKDSERLISFESYLNIGGTMKVRNITGGIASALDKDSKLLQSKILHNLVINDKFRLTPETKPFAVQYAFVSPEYFQLIGAKMLKGSHLKASYSKTLNNPKVVISENFWRERFNSSANVLYDSITVGSKVYSIEGVLSSKTLPIELLKDQKTDFWLPISYADIDNSNLYSFENGLSIIGLLNDGISLSSASNKIEKEFEGVHEDIVASWPANTSIKSYFVNIREKTTEDSLELLILLSIGVTSLFVISIVGISNLTVSNVFDDLSDFAVKALLGAKAKELFKELFLKYLTLLGLASILGILIGHFIKATLVVAGEGHLSRLGEEVPFVNQFIFLLTLSVVISSIYALISITIIKQSSLSSVLKSGTKGAKRSISQLKRISVIAIQITISVLVLAILSNVLIKNINAINGFTSINTNNKHLITLKSTGTEYFDSNVLEEIKQNISEKFSSSKLSVSLNPIIGNMFAITTFTFDDDNKGISKLVTIDEDYLALNQINLLSGRYFDIDDMLLKKNNIIINQKLADKLKITILDGQSITLSDKSYSIIGIVENVTSNKQSEDENSIHQIYQTIDQEKFSKVAISFISNISINEDSLNDILEDNTNIYIDKFGSYEKLTFEHTQKERFIVGIISIVIAFTSLILLASLYGLITFHEISRMPEFAIKKVLGEKSRNQLIQTLKDNLIPLLIGVVTGLALIILIKSNLQTEYFILELNYNIFLMSVLVPTLVIFFTSLIVYQYKKQKLKNVADYL